MVRAKTPSDSGSQLLKMLPALCGIVAIVLILGSAFQTALANTNNTLVYALDDAYIHLSIAKNIVQSRVWGISSVTPASASSSPCWTVLLVIFSLLPVDQVLIPLILNFVFTVALFFALNSLSKSAIPNPWLRAGAATLITFALPIVALVFMGMEHVLHCLLTIFFVAMLIQQPRTERTWKQIAGIAMLGLIMTMTRYESIFLFLVPAAWGLYRRQLILVAPLLGAAVGVILFGLLSHRAGMPFVPATILVKTDVSSTKGFIPAMIERIKFNALPLSRFPMVVEVGYSGVVAVLAIFWAAPRVRLAAASTLVAVAMQVAFASTQQLYRYESYLVAAMGFIVLVGLSGARGTSGIVAKLASAVFAVALIARGVAGFQRTPEAMQNICDQQYQTSQFLAQYYPGRTVALNDIGAVSYYSNCRIVDLIGLANNDVRERKQAGTYNTAAIEQILRANDVDVAILYPSWFKEFGGLPAYLRPVAVWQMDEENIVCRLKSVYLLAPETKTMDLRGAATAFESKLPKTVRVAYYPPPDPFSGPN